MVSKKLSENIKKIREEKGLNLSELSRQAQVSKGYLSQLENGEVKSPSADILFKIAGALGVTISHLYKRDTVGKKVEEVPIPPSLQKAIEEHKEMAPYKEMLAGIEMRGKRPKTKDDWFVLFSIIKKTTLAK